ncbi:MAG: thiamine pyrophosphate-dependent enzyme, partial [Saprospiraceae bacterium]
TQPQGHSTSGSHERYKSKERLQWEKDRDCISIMRTWILENEIISEDDLKNLEEKATKQVKDAKKNAWSAYINPIKSNIKEVKGLYKEVLADTNNDAKVASIINELNAAIDPLFAELVANVRKVLFALRGKNSDAIFELSQWYMNAKETGKQRYNTKLMADGDTSALNVSVVAAQFSDDSKMMNGYEVLNHFFDIKLSEKPELYAFGEDVGQIGDVNQGFAGLQDKYGVDRVFDTGIREWTIMGQALGMSMRGLRPIAEIQYLDYLLYGLEPLSDDMATLRYRSNGLQAAPAIIRTRGHRLEGIWHAGSPIGMLLNALRGMYVCVPRNMTQAAGMYNTLLQSMDPGLVIECLNGYRLKEQLPDN